MSKKILIAGAGYVGSKLASTLAADGYQVFALSRSKKDIPAVSCISADLNDSELGTHLPEDLDFLVYSAAADGRSEEAYQKAYIDGLSNLIKAVKASSQVKRLVFTSSTSVYAQDDGSSVDEESETKPSSFSGQTMLEAENIVLNSELNGAVVRLSGIYGPSRERFKTSSLGLKDLPEFPRKITNRVHLDDCVGTIQFTLENDLKKQILLASDSAPTERLEVINWIRKQAGISELKLTSKVQASGKKCSNNLLVQLGYSFNYPSFREGYSSLEA